MNRLTFTVGGIILSCSLFATAAEDTRPLPLYELLITRDKIATLDESPCGEVFVPAVFSYEGRTWAVETRYRGESSCGNEKRSFFLRFSKKDRFVDGRRRIILKAQPHDWTMMAEKLSYDLFAQTNNPTSLVRFVGLNLNGNFSGVYLDVERPDKPLLERVGRDPGGGLFRGGGFGHWKGQQTTDEYDRRNGPKTEDQALQNFLEWLNRADEDEFRSELPNRMNMESWIDYYAALILSGRNEVEPDDWFLYHDRNTDLWEVIVWDNNNGNFGLGLPWDPPRLHPYVSPLFQTFHGITPINTYWRVLPSRIFDVPEYRTAPGNRLLDLLDTIYTPAAMNALIDANYNAIRIDLARDPYVNQTHVANAPAALKEYVARRGEYLRERIAKDFLAHAQSPIVINEFHTGPSTTWIELFNRGNEELVLDQFALTNDLRFAPLRWNFPENTSVPPGQRLLVYGRSNASEGLHASFDLSKSGGNVALTMPIGDEQMAVADVAFYGNQADGVSFGRSPDGADSYLYFRNTSSGETNRANRWAVPLL